MPDNGTCLVEKRPIEVHTFGSGPKTTLIMAAVHGDEQDGVEVVRAVQSALSAMPEGALDGRRIVLMPCANPDGYVANTRRTRTASISTATSPTRPSALARSRRSSTAAKSRHRSPKRKR